MRKRVEYREYGPMQLKLDMAAGEVLVVIEEDRERAEVVLEPVVPGDEVAEDLIARTEVTGLATGWRVMDVRIPHPELTRVGAGIHQSFGSIAQGAVVTGVVVVNGQVISGNPTQGMVSGGGVRVTARVPVGSEVWPTTVSADVDIQGRPECIRFTSTSGDLRVDTATEVWTRTVSGDVDLGACLAVNADTTSGSVIVGRAWSVEARTVSGDVTIDRFIGDAARLRSTSGTLRLHASTTCKVTAVTTSGGIAITADDPPLVEVFAHSISGRVRTPQN
ncbi:DUF4097 family beta strand repeat-containing protein [Saccharopolyspora sp. NPDC000359]|uniref:DUF4097 family beta strand repeat-containing protein n=1 Tax=Saccharopolyspora sp. NPDC000359 TaxID=3154251 RepID=UPI003320E5B4